MYRGTTESGYRRRNEPLNNFTFKGPGVVLITWSLRPLSQVITHKSVGRSTQTTSDFDLLVT